MTLPPPMRPLPCMFTHASLTSLLLWIADDGPSQSELDLDNMDTVIARLAPLMAAAQTRAARVMCECGRSRPHDGRCLCGLVPVAQPPPSAVWPPNIWHVSTL